MSIKNYLEVNPMTDDQRAEIDAMPYEQMLRMWRYGQTDGNPHYWEGERGRYFATVMAEKKQALSHKEQVEISKQIGWNE